MEKKDFPFRLVFFVIITIIVFSFLIWLNFQSQDGILHWLTTMGICLGVVWVIFLAGTIYGVVVERKRRIYRAKEPERLKQHQDRFYCHICGKPSPQPDQYWEDYGENGLQYYSFIVVDYNKPTELVQCAICQKWTCPNADPPHLENGVCKKCLENTPEKVQLDQSMRPKSMHLTCGTARRACNFFEHFAQCGVEFFLPPVHLRYSAGKNCPSPPANRSPKQLVSS